MTLRHFHHCEIDDFETPLARTFTFYDLYYFTESENSLIFKSPCANGRSEAIPTWVDVNKPVSAKA